MLVVLPESHSPVLAVYDDLVADLVFYPIYRFRSFGGIFSQKLVLLGFGEVESSFFGSKEQLFCAKQGQITVLIQVQI